MVDTAKVGNNDIRAKGDLRKYIGADENEQKIEINEEQ
jgi:hypothetical protein